MQVLIAPLSSSHAIRVGRSGTPNNHDSLLFQLRNPDYTGPFPEYQCPPLPAVIAKLTPKIAIPRKAQAMQAFLL